MCHTHTCKHSHMQSVCDRIECVGSNASEQIMCDDCFCESENMTARRLWHSLRACERRYRAYNMLVGVRVHKNDTKKNMIVCVQPFSSVWCISYRNYTRFFFFFEFSGNCGWHLQPENQSGWCENKRFLKFQFASNFRAFVPPSDFRQASHSVYGHSFG